MIKFNFTIHSCVFSINYYIIRISFEDIFFIKLIILISKIKNHYTQKCTLKENSIYDFCLLLMNFTFWKNFSKSVRTHPETYVENMDVMVWSKKKKNGRRKYIEITSLKYSITLEYSKYVIQLCVFVYFNI